MLFYHGARTTNYLDVRGQIHRLRRLHGLGKKRQEGKGVRRLRRKSLRGGQIFIVDKNSCRIAMDLLHWLVGLDGHGVRSCNHTKPCK
ncbi:MAG: hypothetical protein DRH24_20285 [Deltaproteobacteria bacterium]|nr:MAG: hypothetical protein DRH24_20285 [Deltaproteobacteria bacterium]